MVPLTCGFASDRTGKYSGHSGPIIQLLRLGEVLLSLGADRKLVVWDIGTYDEPQVFIQSLIKSGMRVEAEGGGRWCQRENLNTPEHFLVPLHIYMLQNHNLMRDALSRATTTTTTTCKPAAHLAVRDVLDRVRFGLSRDFLSPNHRLSTFFDLSCMLKTA